jgi:hypothetical protein
MSKYNRYKTSINQLQDDSDDDSNNESFIQFCTEITETTQKKSTKGIEDPGKFQPVWNQQVTDEKGRRRFHGAFTGGFSAGYYNSVGSKEGMLKFARGKLASAAISDICICLYRLATIHIRLLSKYSTR